MSSSEEAHTGQVSPKLSKWTLAWPSHSKNQQNNPGMTPEYSVCLDSQELAKMDSITVMVMHKTLHHCTTLDCLPPGPVAISHVGCELTVPSTILSFVLALMLHVA